MSPAVNLFDHLLATAAQMQQIGRLNDAFSRLCKLASFRGLPPEVASETHLRMAEILLKRRRPARARKHLKVVLRHAPEHARAHQLMAEAQEGGRLPDPYLALEHCRRSLELQPEQLECLCAAGRLAVQQGLWEEGLDHLRKAAALGGDDPRTLRKVVDGMLLANQADEARGLLRAALFRHAHDRRFRGLWDHFQFQELRKQQGEAQARRQKSDADEAPMLLRFAPPTSGQLTRRKAAQFRRDGVSGLAGPHPVIIGRSALHHSAR